MTRQDIERITELLVEVGGRRAWVLIWDEQDSDEIDGTVLASVKGEDLPELLCYHLLRLLQHRLGPADIITREQ